MAAQGWLALKGIGSTSHTYSSQTILEDIYRKVLEKSLFFYMEYSTL